MVYVEENVGLRYCDGKDKYFHSMGIKTCFVTSSSILGYL